MPTQIITLSISGANAQTQQIQINVDPNSGVGTGTFTYTGSNSGTDMITASTTVGGAQRSSNTAQVNWQQTNGRVQIAGGVTMYMWNDSNHSTAIVNYPKFNQNDPAAASLGLSVQPASSSSNGLAILSTSVGYVGSAQGNSFLIDYPTLGDNNDIAWEILNSSGGIVGSTSPFPGTDENFNLVLLGNLLIPDTNIHTISFTSKDYCNIGLGGGLQLRTRPIGSVGQTLSAMNGYPLVAASPSTGNDNTSYGSGSFSAPTPGVYPIEANFDYWYHSGRTFQLTIDGQNPAPITSMSAPPNYSPSGNLIITPAGGNSNLVIQGNTITLTIQISGVAFSQIPYVPLFEGTSGEIFVAGGVGASGAGYGLPTVPGGVSVDPSAAVSRLFAISADNTSIQGLLSLQATTTGSQPAVGIAYSGAAVPANLASSQLTVQQSDLAWFNGVNKSFDVFTPTSAGGGSSDAVQINWLVNPSLSGVSPSSLPADGGTHTLVVSLAKPLPPVQNNIQANFSISGGVTLTEVSVNTNSQGFVTGWNLTVTTPQLYSNTSVTVSLSATGQLTYLNGTAFSNTTVNYFNGGTSVSITLTA